MILVTCTTCGVVFDLEVAPRCDGHDAGGRSGFSAEYCFLCPLGHAGHDSVNWKKANRRPPTDAESEIGITFMLPDYDVNLGER